MAISDLKSHLLKKCKTAEIYTDLFEPKTVVPDYFQDEVKVMCRAFS